MGLTKVKYLTGLCLSISPPGNILDGNSHTGALFGSTYTKTWNEIPTQVCTEGTQTSRDMLCWGIRGNLGVLPWGSRYVNGGMQVTDQQKLQPHVHRAMCTGLKGLVKMM